MGVAAKLTQRPGDRGIERGDLRTLSAARFGASLRSGLAIRLLEVRGTAGSHRGHDEHEPRGTSLGEWQVREFHEDAEAGRDRRPGPTVTWKSWSRTWRSS